MDNVSNALVAHASIKLNSRNGHERATRAVGHGSREGGRPYRGIGDAAGLSHVTVRRLIAEGRTSPTTISKVASALRLDEATVYEWAGIELSDWGVWNPPAEAHRLNPRARAALEELIRAVTQDGGSGDAGNAGPKKALGGDTPPDEDGAAPDMLDVRDEAIRIAIQDDQTLAARHEREHGKMKTTDDAQKLAGEENQDDGGEDPA